MGNDELIDLKRLVKIILRQKFTIIICVLAFFLIALLYVLFATPQYTAKASVLLDRSLTQAVSDISAVKQVSFEGAALESEVEILKSRRVAVAAIESLGGISYFSDDDNKTIDDVVRDLNSKLNVSRVGETYVMNIQYTSDSPKMAAEIANAYAEAYISDQLAAMSEISEKTIIWLQDKIEEIREKSIEAEEEVAHYRLQLNRRQQTGGPAADDIVDANLSVLRSLEKEAETYDSLYESYLENLETISTQQSFPVTETRIISSAVQPKDKSHPQVKLILGASIILGAGLGLVLAILIENFDKTLRRAGQIRREIGVPFLGFLPLRKNAKRENLDFVSKSKQTHQISFSRTSINEPNSLYSETIRSIRNAFDMKPDGKVIGIVSADSNEGKSILAENLAYFLAQSSNCVFVDADMAEPTKIVGSNVKIHVKSIGNVLRGEVTLDNALLYSSESNLSILPSLASDKKETHSYLSVKSAKAIIDGCKTNSDYVVVNMPQLMAPADFYSFAQNVDQIIVIAEWGKSLSNTINFHLNQNDIKQNQILGLILENADMRKMDKHYGHKASA